MKQVIDSNGNHIVGLFKKDDGALVVLNNKSYENSLREKQKSEEIQSLKQRIEILENFILKGK
jgi:hypothetical protein